jgi:hypothetical protein
MVDIAQSIIVKERNKGLEEVVGGGLYRGNWIRGVDYRRTPEPPTSRVTAIARDNCSSRDCRSHPRLSCPPPPLVRFGSAVVAHPPASRASLSLGPEGVPPSLARPPQERHRGSSASGRHHCSPPRSPPLAHPREPPPLKPNP